MKKISGLIKKDKLTPKSALIILMMISCLTGFYFNFQWSIIHYRPIESTSHYYGTTHYFTNNMIIRLKSFGEIAEIKQYLYPDQSVGFFTDTPYTGELNYMVFASLLAPVLLDRDSPQSHRHVIMYLEKNSPKEAAAQIRHRLTLNLGENLFIADK